MSKVLGKDVSKLVLCTECDNREGLLRGSTHTFDALKRGQSHPWIVFNVRLSQKLAGQMRGIFMALGSR